MVIGVGARCSTKPREVREKGERVSQAAGEATRKPCYFYEKPAETHERGRSSGDEEVMF